MNNTKSALTILFFAGLILLSRWLPHPPNFTPVLAVALFCGSRFSKSSWAYLMPVIAMIISDLVIGMHDLMLVVYASLLPMVWLASRWPKQKILNSFFASVWFFAITNFAVWYTGSVVYAPTLAGLEECYVAALPFFHNTLISTFVFMGVFELVAKFAPQVLPEFSSAANKPA